MLRYFNKDKKKQPQINTILPLEEFFSRTEYEISLDFWKMNATQLEEIAKKQEKFISHLKKLYQQQLDLLDQHSLKHEEELKKLRNEIEELQIRNQSNIEQKELMESQYKEMYEKQQAEKQHNEKQHNEKQSPDKLQQQPFDLLDLNEPISEEVERLRNQCTKVCEEMRRLQEDNDDLNTALETEKSFTEKIKQQKQQIIDSLQSQIATYEKQLSDQSLEQLQQQQKLSSQEDLDQRLKDLESKNLQEKIKCDQKTRDCARLEESLTDYKKQVDSMSQQFSVYEGKIKLLENKRQKDKSQILQLKSEIQQCRTGLQEQNLGLQLKVDELNKQLEALQVTQDDLDRLRKEIAQKQQEIVEQKVFISGLELQLNEQQSLSNSLIKQQKELEEHHLGKQCELEKLVSNLSLRRENAKLEIEQLNKKLEQCKQVIDSIKSKASKNSDIQTIIKNNNELLDQSSQKIKTSRRIQIFPTLRHCLQELRKSEDTCYKQFIQSMMSEFKEKEEIVNLERMLNDIQRRSQDMIDLLDEIGLR